MKTTSSKTTQNESSASKSFFNKGGEGSFFSKDNQTGNSFFSASGIQASLTVGQPDDPFEKEAEKVSRQVVEGFDQANNIQRKLSGFGLQQFAIQPLTIGGRISRKLQSFLSRRPLLVQPKCNECEQEEKMQQKSGDIQFAGEGSPVSADIESRIQNMRGGGQSMDDATKTGMESSFGADFSGVKIHTSSQAVQMSQNLNAHAFTVGNDIFFNEGRYQPATKQGAGLLAHELTHTVQQGSSVQGKRVSNQSLLRSLSEHSVAHLSGIGGSESSTSGREEIAELEKLPEDEITKMQQLQMLQMKDVDEVQEEGEVGIMSFKGAGGGAPAPAPGVNPPAPATTVDIGDINAPNTPTPVKRIIPRVNTGVNVTVTNSIAANPVILSIDGGGAGNGTATINGGATHNLAASGIVNIKGVDQTDAGKANNLKLVAKQGTSTLAQSNSFSVAAYPIAIAFSFKRLMEGEAFPGMAGSIFWGAAYDLSFTSDSGVNSDCDKTKISENVITGSATGLWAGAASNTSNFLKTTNTQTDHHARGSANAATMKSSIDAADPASHFIVDQFFRFSCKRTNINLAEDKTTGPKVPASGFKVSRSISKYFIHVKKEGFANNAVDAGAVNDTAIKNAKIN